VPPRHEDETWLAGWQTGWTRQLSLLVHAVLNDERKVVAREGTHAAGVRSLCCALLRFARSAALFCDSLALLRSSAIRSPARLLRSFSCCLLPSTCTLERGLPCLWWCARAAVAAFCGLLGSSTGRRYVPEYFCTVVRIRVLQALWDAYRNTLGHAHAANECRVVLLAELASVRENNVAVLAACVYVVRS
jgi:hypothetical protein